MFNVFLCVPIRFHCIRLLKLYACKGFRKRSYEPGSPCSAFSCFIQQYFSILLNKINDDELMMMMMMPAARLVCQRPSSNFPYFRTPPANFLLSRPNSVEYGNSKTTTLLLSAKCTGMRPLFQGRTGCGGRPSGWHDIVTCQRLVYFFVFLMQFGL